MTSIFADRMHLAWPYKFAGTLRVRSIAGGTPSDPNIAEGWLKTKLTDNRDELIRAEVAKVMEARGMTVDQAAAEVDMTKHLNGFKFNDDGLYLDARCLKAGIKEAASVARAANKLKQKWGATGKGVLGFVAEHIMVVEEILQFYIPESDGTKRYITKEDDTITSFPKNPRTNQTGIQHTQIVLDACMDFTIVTDWDFSDEEWAILWLTAEMQGIGASRSQSFGRYEVVRWEKVPAKS
jgi:hypothetical protein